MCSSDLCEALGSFLEVVERAGVQVACEGDAIEVDGRGFVNGGARACDIETAPYPGLATDLQHWAPDAPVAAVICTPAAFADLSPAERERVITLLQSATADGGVHLVETIVAGQVALTEDELRTHYRDWDVRFVADTGDARTFVATKHVM